MWVSSKQAVADTVDFAALAGRAAGSDEDESIVAGQEVPGRLERHGDELSGRDGDLLVIDDEPAVAADGGVDVLDVAVEVGVGLGGFPGRELDLVDLDAVTPSCSLIRLSKGLAAGCGPRPAVMVTGSTTVNDIDAGYGWDLFDCGLSEPDKGPAPRLIRSYLTHGPGVRHWRVGL